MVSTTPETIPIGLLQPLAGGICERRRSHQRSAASRFLQLEQQVEELEEEDDRKDEKIEQLEEQLQEKDEKIKELESRPRKYENPHTPPSKRRSATRRSPTLQDDEDDDTIRTDGGTPGRKQGHDPE